MRCVFFPFDTGEPSKPPVRPIRETDEQVLERLFGDDHPTW